jgi:tetratricopeptide (TPR) repeat protein
MNAGHEDCPMNKPIQIVASLIFSCFAIQSAALAEYPSDRDGISRKYVKNVLRLASAGSRTAYESKGSDANEELANIWLYVDRKDLSALINDADKKALASYQKNDLQSASDRLYCGLDCAAMFSRSLAWGNGHLEGAELNQSKPLVWLDSFAEANIDVEGVPSDKTFSFPASQYIAAVNNYAYYMQRQGKHAEVIPVFEKIIELDPDRTVAYLNLADSLWATGDKEEASKRYCQYVSQCQNMRYNRVPDRAMERYLASAER